MYRFALLVSVFLTAEGLRLPTTCRDAGSAVDSAVAAANAQFKAQNITQNAEDVQVDVFLSIEGYSVPVKFNLNMKEGELKPLYVFSKADEIQLCTNATASYLTGVFQFNSLQLHYANVKATFFVGEFDGQLTYRVWPQVNVIVEQRGDDCRLVVFNIAKTDNVAYNFQANSWLGIFAEQEIDAALLEADSTNMLLQVENLTKNYVSTYFIPAWCNTVKST